MNELCSIIVLKRERVPPPILNKVINDNVQYLLLEAGSLCLGGLAST